ncbi:hypothetical protein [Novosphingobium sp. Leaf2]|uniref:hypothetical protein n=1 Tax=Novosphingobium sp. Leaf2 TaxID=1735670 RepID=UPI0006FF0142|nr:hypothetical protein [Novosphingobium sp. Leaf2]KQM22021.1 hypothetical protein ASE49_01555 [Novosphingobium sp. Leaf2]
MATTRRWRSGEKGAGSPYPVRQPSRWKRNLAILITLVLVVCLALVWRGMQEKALVGAAYGAQSGCVCRFVSQRPLASCQADLAIAGVGGTGRWVSLSEDAAKHTIHASVPLLARQSADFSSDRGCQLEPWQD